MKKNKLLIVVACLGLLSGCNGTSSDIVSSIDSTSTSDTSSITSENQGLENNLESIVKIASQINKNFTVTGDDAGMALLVKRNEKYMFDQYNNGGIAVLNDNNAYSYKLIDGSLSFNVEPVGTKNTFAEHYPAFDIDTSKFTENDGKFYSVDPENCASISLLANYGKAKSKVSLFIANNQLNFELLDEEDNVLVEGAVSDIGTTSIAEVEEYIASGKIPAYEHYENPALVAAFAQVNDNYTFEGTKYNSETVKYKVTNYAFYEYSSARRDEVGSGMIVLNDNNLYNFEIESGIIDVKVGAIGTKGDYVNAVAKPNIDFTLFKPISEKSYSCDNYETVNQLVTFLGGSYVRSVIVTLNDDGSITCAFSSGAGSDLTGTISNINSTVIKPAADYIATNKIPSLPEYENEALLSKVNNLKMNYTFIGQNFLEDEVKIYSTNYGRYVILPEYSSSDRATNYVVVNNNAYRFYYDNETLDVKYQNNITKDEFNSRYSFENVNFKYFKETETAGIYECNYEDVINQFSYLLGVSSSNVTNVSLDATGDNLKIKLTGGISNSVTIEGEIKLINDTELPFLEDYIASGVIPTQPVYENKELLSVVHNLQNGNFTVKYQSDPAYDITFDEDDYDYWTEEAVYFGYYQGGLVEKKGRVYGYNIEDGAVAYTDPYDNIPSIASYNPIYLLDDELVSYFVPGENNTYSSDVADNIEIFALLMDCTSYVNQLYSVNLSIVNNELKAELIYSDGDVFATAVFGDIGTTVLPISL